MKKYISLIKTSLNHDMNFFKVHTKKKGKSTVIIPLFATLYIMFIVGLYSEKTISLLKPLHLEFITLTLFTFLTSIITFIEGIYKSGPMLFNCKDDQLLFSLPLKKSTVLFIRILKLYIFELLYNSLFLIPSLIVYAYELHPNWTYYLTSLVALLILPIIPIILSCIIGFITVKVSSKFKGKNIVQTIFAMMILLLFLFISYNLDGIMNNLSKNASDINDLLTKIYYPIGTYISLINSFNIKKIIIYILIHLILFSATIFLLGKVYFSINSNSKRIITKYKNNNYKIKQNSKALSFVKKELNRFFSTPVFITNAGFGLVLYIIACILITLKFGYFANMITKTYPSITEYALRSNISVILFILIAFTSLMTSITSSMISLENKSINLLKSLPVTPIMVALYKVLSALVIMIPCILIGDIIIFIKFNLDIISIILLLLLSVIMPAVSEMIGILVNLKYPKLDATNDTEIVKQSISSMLSVFIGMGLLGMTGIMLYKLIKANIPSSAVLLIFIIIYTVILLLLTLILTKTCDKSFKNISI